MLLAHGRSSLSWQERCGEPGPRVPPAWEQGWAYLRLPHRWSSPKERYCRLLQHPEPSSPETDLSRTIHHPLLQ